METEDQLDPFSPFTFIIEIEGVARAGFSECSGLATGPKPISYRTVSNHRIKSDMSGSINFAHVTLKRGLMQHSYWTKWHQSSLDGYLERRSVSIVMRNEAREELVRFNLQGAWISKWEGPQLTDSTHQLAVESIDLYYDGLEILS